VVKRDWVLGYMTRGRYTIAVAGSHGKTTITAMIALILTEAGLDPTFIVGGILEDLGTNAKAGQGEHFVIEADEYDRTFLGLKPNIAVVTNIEMDHPDCYPRLDDMVEAFREFVKLVPKAGCVVGCGDEERVRELLEARSWKLKAGRVITYGLGEGVDWRAVDIRPNELGGNDFVALHDGRVVGEFGLRIPGIHNVANALAAMAVADHLGIDPARVRKALQGFQGVKRRFEVKGEAGGVTVVDDYAHHPTQIRTTLATARERYPGRQVWAFFQPHTYSRTKALLDDFAASFADADHVVVSDIYAAREFDDLGVSAADIVARMAHPDARYIADLDDVIVYLLPRLRPGDVLITLGAGDGYKVGEGILAGLKGSASATGKTRCLRHYLQAEGWGDLCLKREKLERIRDVLGDRVRLNEPMALHTSFRIGGPADLYAVATSSQELAELVALAREHEVPYLIIGAGTNILVADKGIRGLVIENRLQITDCRLQGDEAILYTESGALLCDLARESARQGLAGLEWAVGIPGSVGGAIVGNAGAYGRYMSDVVRGATVLGTDGEARYLTTGDLGFGYRTSRFKGAKGKGQEAREVILSAELVLHRESPEVLEARMDDYTRRREARQPSEPSAGSVFKRTEQYPAGFLIEQAGLKGKRIGNAQISPKHANFIVNLGGAKASDVKALIDLARERVFTEFGIELELEIELVGEWGG